MKRSSGILLPISSLPSKYGIGTLGKAAYDFVDFLVKAKQSYWQVLPIGHTSYGDSPYQCFSNFAGNPYFIDFDLLLEDKLISKSDLKSFKGIDNSRIDYEFQFNNRYKVLYKAYQNGINIYTKEFNKFKRTNSSWLFDYALFMSLKKYFNNASWNCWPDIDIKLRKENSINKYSKLLKEDIEFYEFIQFLFYKQCSKLKQYANDKGIKIIGDIPFYVPLDSCEVWTDGNQFQLHKNTKVPKAVAGVPPDYFSETGQLWGNPLYDWNYIKKENYSWWLKRIEGLSKYFDVIRIDHFIGFERYWSIPYGSETTINGKWNKGPSYNFIKLLNEKFKSTEFIAEDLGILTDNAKKLLKKSGFPGMRVLEFVSTHDESSYHCLHNHVENGVCYTSTHDNSPIIGWFNSLNYDEKQYLIKQYKLDETNINIGFVEAGLSSKCNLFICQIQDYIGLGDEARINTPGLLNNWTWRLDKKYLNAKLSKQISSLTVEYERSK